MVLIAPVAVHRVSFRRHGRQELVGAAHRTGDVGVALLACAVVGVVLLVFDVVRGSTVGIVAGSLTATTVVLLWVLLPRRMRRDTAIEKADDEAASSG